MKTDTLTIPRHSDPLARAALLGLFALVAYLNIAQPGEASLSAQAPIIIVATAALNQQLAVPPHSSQELGPRTGQEAWPTPYQLPPTDTAQPAVELAAPTIDPAHLALPQPTAAPTAAPAV